MATATMTANAASHPYTCNTCQVAFRGSDLQRGHMQSDWHRYNLKRRVASLPPLTSEIFAEKVLANQASAAATAARAQFEKTCTACSRTYFSENAYTNHLQSQKHKLKLAELSRGGDTETEDGTESMTSSAFSLGALSMDTVTKQSEADSEVSQLADGLERANVQHPEATSSQTGTSTPSATPTPTTESSTYPAEPTHTCLFCNLTSTDVTQNITHMSRTHGLFIPEQTYLVDLPGLLAYLHERIHILHECLYCGQLKYTATGIQTHMRDKGHCMIAFESEEEMVEVGQFYDFSSTYSDDEGEGDEEDAEDDPTTKGSRSKLGANRAATYEAEGDGEGEEDNEDWDSASDDDDDATSDASDTPRPLKNKGAYTVGSELYLPSGRTAGHRSLARYYRQNLHSYPTPAERFEASQRLITDGTSAPGSNNPFNAGRARGQVLTGTGQSLHLRGRTGREVVSRAGGGLGLIGASEEQRTAAMKMEKQERRKQQRAELRYTAGVQRRANNMKHYRDPLLQ